MSYLCVVIRFCRFANPPSRHGASFRCEDRVGLSLQLEPLRLWRDVEEMDPRARTQTFSGILRAHLPEQRPLHVAALTNKMAGLGRTCLRQRSAASCRRRCERIVRGRGRELTGGAERGAERGAESTAEISAERAAIGPARMWRTVRWARWTLRGRAQQQRKRRPAAVTNRCLGTRRGKRVHRKGERARKRGGCGNPLRPARAMLRSKS